MKNLGKDIQISAQSHPEIMPGLDELTSRLAKADRRFIGRKLRPGHVLNGMILMLLDRPNEEQLALADRAVSRLERWALESEGNEQERSSSNSAVSIPKGAGGQKRSRKHQPKRADQPGTADDSP